MHPNDAYHDKVKLLELYSIKYLIFLVKHMYSYGKIKGITQNAYYIILHVLFKYNFYISQVKVIKI